ncbi:nicotianamine synthase-like [Hibiscus syriacus]|uniref:Nicotianamine synthase-like n=1 Tax=Hibiscus syriacus TaxID=106335 RepID=A0A6A2XQG1_HIBSY|nr:nicotianamine synthase-like [Hibiscus syriacus]
MRSARVEKAKLLAMDKALNDAMSQGVPFKDAKKQAEKVGKKAAKLASEQTDRITGPIITSGWDFFEAVYYGGSFPEGAFRGQGMLLGSYGGGFFGEQLFGRLGYLLGSQFGGWVGGRIGLMVHDVAVGLDFDAVRRYSLFIPVLGQPLPSNRYYIIHGNGKYKGLPCQCATEDDESLCCSGRFIPDMKPKPFDHRDESQQFEICSTARDCFIAKPSVPHGLPPRFLSSGTNVIVRIWYTPFMFVKDHSLRVQIETTLFYNMTLERLWEKIHSSEKNDGMWRKDLVELSGSRGMRWLEESVGWVDGAKVVEIGSDGGVEGSRGMADEEGQGIFNKGLYKKLSVPSNTMLLDTDLDLGKNSSSIPIGQRDCKAKFGGFGGDELVGVDRAERVVISVAGGGGHQIYGCSPTNISL